MVLPRLVRTVAGAVVAATTLAVVSAPAERAEDPPDVTPGSSSIAGGVREDGARTAFATAPLGFEANQGQSDARVQYLARGDGFTLFLTRDGAVFDLQPRGLQTAGTEAAERGPARRATAGTVPPSPAVAVSLDVVGGDRTPRIEARSRQDATTSYFVDDGGRREVPSFEAVRYVDLYPGIDLQLRGARSAPEYGFVIAPGADPAAIGYRLRGAESVRLDSDGDLVAATAAGDFVHRVPLAYQQLHGERLLVPAAYRLVDDVVQFDVGAYDPSRPLVVVPTTDLPYSSYLGGAGYDSATAVALDGSDVYVTGYAGSDFPTTTGAYDPSTNGSVDAFVSRLTIDDAGGLTLAYSTILGGSDDDWGQAIAVDQGDVYLTGSTRSHDFPSTTGAYDTTFNGARLTDTFVARVSPDGAGSADLVYSTFLGGTGFDLGYDLAVAGGDVSVFGYTESAAFPATPGAFDISFGGYSDVFFATISPDGNQEADLVYSTFLGGADVEDAGPMVLHDGDAYLAGRSWGSDFPTTPGAYDTTPTDTALYPDAYLTRLSPDGAGAADLVYSTYLGGEKDDVPAAIAVSGGDVFLAGSTGSAQFPTAAGAYDRTFNGRYDAFVATISPDGDGRDDLTYSTFLGARGDDFAESLVVEGDAYVSGGTDSSGFPTTRGAHDRSFNGGSFDAFVARIRTGTAAAGLVHSTFLGGSDWDLARGMSVVDGTAYITGETLSGDFPTTTGAYDGMPNGGYDAFLTLLRLPDDRYRPDGWIRLGRGRDHGDGVYNTTGRHQTRSAHARRGERTVFWLTAQNDSRFADRLVVTGPGSTAQWRVRYHRDGTDITSEVVGDGFSTRLLGSGGRVPVRVDVTPRTAAPVGSTKSVRIVLTSRGESASQDAVRARVTVERG